MDGADFRRAELRLGQDMLDALLLADHAHHARVARPQRTKDFRFGHGVSPLFLSMISAQTRSAFVAREDRFPPRNPSAGQAFSGSCLSARDRGDAIEARRPSAMVI